MPIYRYVCGKPKTERCTLSNLPKGYFDGEGKTEHEIDIFKSRLTEWTEDGLIDPEKSVIVQLVFHMMDETKEVKCPACGVDSKRIIGQSTFFFPGDCFLNKADCRRHIAIDKLENDDPYGHIRPEGDKEALIKKFKRGDKAEAKHFFPGGSGGLKASSRHEPGS